MPSSEMGERQPQTLAPQGLALQILAPQNLAESALSCCRGEWVYVLVACEEMASLTVIIDWVCQYKLTHGLHSWL